MNLNILLDCDGVLADFASAAIRIHNRPETHADIKRYDFWLDWGMTTDDFWKPIKRDFWLSLEPYPYAVGFFEDLSEIGEITISTAHAGTSNAPMPSCNGWNLTSG